MNGSEGHQTRAAGTGTVPAATVSYNPGGGGGRSSPAAEAGVGMSEEDAAWSLPASEEVGSIGAEDAGTTAAASAAAKPLS